MEETPSFDLTTIAADVARQLNETDLEALTQIERIIQCVGPEKTYAFLQKAIVLHSEGRRLTRDGSRQRTLGGTFFFLVRGRVTGPQHAIIWPKHKYPYAKAPEGKTPERKEAPPSPKTKPPLPQNWAEHAPILAEARQQQGVAVTVKITLIGHPGRIVERGEAIITTLTSDKVPPLPKGLPLPPEEPTVYLIYIARKQWQKIAQAATNPQDKLIVEGFPFQSKQLGVIGVLAINATTVNTQRAKLPPKPKS